MFRLAMLVALMLALIPSAALAQATPCQFILGFKTLHDLDPTDIGNCLDNQAFAANGDAQQHTTNGLMAWRKADNWTAFTNGYWTWINGPYGLAKRLNTQRFAWEANPTYLPVTGPQTTFGNGTFFVGKDILPGTYRTRAGSLGCYWARLSGTTGAISELLANDFGNDPMLVTILPTDVAFKSDGCATWTTDLSPLTASPDGPVASGALIVGHDISSGTWRSTTGCIWGRFSDFTRNLGSVLATGAGQAPQTVTILATDVEFEAQGCGTWTKIG